MALHLSSKRRMEKLGVQMELESSRRSYSKEPPVRSASYFDGKYNINDVYEEIYAIRTFLHSGRKIKSVYDKEVAHYTFLSAKSVGKMMWCVQTAAVLLQGAIWLTVVISAEQNLLSKTWTIGSAALDSAVISRWVTASVKQLKINLSPDLSGRNDADVLYRIFLPFLYGKDMNFLLRFAMGLFCGAGLGFAGFALVSFAMFLSRLPFWFSTNTGIS